MWVVGRVDLKRRPGGEFVACWKGSEAGGKDRARVVANPGRQLCID